MKGPELQGKQTQLTLGRPISSCTNSRRSPLGSHAYPFPLGNNGHPPTSACVITGVFPLKTRIVK